MPNASIPNKYWRAQLVLSETPCENARAKDIGCVLIDAIHTRTTTDPRTSSEACQREFHEIALKLLGRACVNCKLLDWAQANLAADGGTSLAEIDTEHEVEGS